MPQTTGSLKKGTSYQFPIFTKKVISKNNGFLVKSKES